MTKLIRCISRDRWTSLVNHVQNGLWDDNYSPLYVVFIVWARIVNRKHFYWRWWRSDFLVLVLKASAKEFFTNHEPVCISVKAVSLCLVSTPVADRSSIPAAGKAASQLVSTPLVVFWGQYYLYRNRTRLVPLPKWRSGGQAVFTKSSPCCPKFHSLMLDGSCLPLPPILQLLLLLLLLLLTAIELSLGGSSPSTSRDKTNKNIHKRNSTKTQYKQYKTQ